MYVTTENQCNVPNGEAPLPANWAAASDARRAQMEAQISQAQAAYARLVERVPSDFADLKLKFQFPDFSTPGIPKARLPWPEGYKIGCISRAPLPAGYVPLRPVQQAPPALSQYVPLVSAAPAPAPVDNATPAAQPPPKKTNDVCVDLKNGTVLQSQVSSAQLWDCAVRGYRGANPSPLDVVQDAISGKLPNLSGVDDSGAAAGALVGLGLVLAAAFAWRRGRR